MGIVVKEKQFHLQTGKTSYIMMVNTKGILCHLYYGTQMENVTIGSIQIEKETNVDSLPVECAVFGTGDYRIPTVEVELENGSMANELRYKCYQIIEGKPKINGLPSTYAKEEDKVSTLIITLEDQYADYEADLIYSVFPSYNVITRRIRYRNTGKGNQPIKLHRALSFSLDFDQDNYELLQLSGAWSREKTVYKRPLVPGIQEIDSKRGISSAVQNPFLALLGETASEDMGEVYGFNLVYSGNFAGTVEVDPNHRTRVAMGINPFQFGWELVPGQEFETPEAVLVYSDQGLGEMSRTYHKFYRERLCRGSYQFKERPILINNWEATYFQFTEEKLLEIAKAGKELGMELFVLDDGWFGHRDLDDSSLGDWMVDYRKLPNGLSALADKIDTLGMGFGLWFEPEMISIDSKLYESHPDWCIHVPERAPQSTMHQRNQLILDLSRQDVCEYVIRAVSSILASSKISYVKWDMNRSMTDCGSISLNKRNQREFSHRYMLGLYYILETITSNFPNVLFESCCSGGGRFDPGMLYYMPQTWTSDDTDAVERIKIQYGTSLVYPPVTMSCHVSACPNHQVGRLTSLKTRGDVAMCGNFGYELDATKFTEEEKQQVKAQVVFYKEIRPVIQFGELYRLKSPYDGDGNEAAYCYVNEEKSEAVVFWYQILARPCSRLQRLKLKGLVPQQKYQILGTGVTAYGDELMKLGIERFIENGDFRSEHYVLRAVPM
ncbi:MAG: alpha-galactosidase [bacterium]|nr:alpha-galactosidase [bacterium]